MIVCVIHGPARCGKTTFLHNLRYALDGPAVVAGDVRVESSSKSSKYNRSSLQRLADSGVEHLLIDDCSYEEVEEAQAVAFAEGPSFCRDLTLYMVRNS